MYMQHVTVLYIYETFCLNWIVFILHEVKLNADNKRRDVVVGEVSIMRSVAMLHWTVNNVLVLNYSVAILTCPVWYLEYFFTEFEMCIFKVNICILCFENQPGNCTPANCMCITWETCSSPIGYHVLSHLKKTPLFKIKTEANEVMSVKNNQCSKSIKIFIFHCEMLILTDITHQILEWNNALFTSLHLPDSWDIRKKLWHITITHLLLIPNTCLYYSYNKVWMMK